MLSAVMLSVIILNAIMLNVITLSAIMLNVIRLSVVAPKFFVGAIQCVNQNSPVMNLCWVEPTFIQTERQIWTHY